MRAQSSADTDHPDPSASLEMDPGHSETCCHGRLTLYSPLSRQVMLSSGMAARMTDMSRGGLMGRLASLAPCAKLASICRFT